MESGTKVNIDKLDSLQVRSILYTEYCLNVGKRREISELYHRYNLESLTDRRTWNEIKLMYNETGRSVI